MTSAYGTQIITGSKTEPSSLPPTNENNQHAEDPDDLSYFTKLMNDDLFQTPVDIGDPGARDYSYPPGELGPIHDPDEGHDCYYETNGGETETEAPKSSSQETGPSSPSNEFIFQRGLPRGTDSTSWDDTSEPVMQPAPDPHFQHFSSRYQGVAIQFAGAKRTQEKESANQWSICGDIYRAVGRTISHIPAGIYALGEDMRGAYFQARTVLSDDIIQLPDEPSQEVVAGIKKFWASKDRYEEHGLVYKRGVLMYGPQGGGKTITSMLIAQQLVSSGGIVVMSNCSPRTMSEGLHSLRSVEHDRPIVALLEDIDDIKAMYGEHALLALLDGEDQLANVTYVATTNYPERLGARLLNRPSRFDQRVFVDMPSKAAREVYLQHASKGKLTPEQLHTWAADTDKMSIAHLKELVIAVLVLDHNYAESVTRLRSLGDPPHSKQYNDGFNQ